MLLLPSSGAAFHMCCVFSISDLWRKGWLKHDCPFYPLTVLRAKKNQLRKAGRTDNAAPCLFSSIPSHNSWTNLWARRARIKHALELKGCREGQQGNAKPPLPRKDRGLTGESAGGKWKRVCEPLPEQWEESRQQGWCFTLSLPKWYMFYVCLAPVGGLSLTRWTYQMLTSSCKCTCVKCQA